MTLQLEAAEIKGLETYVKDLVQKAMSLQVPAWYTIAEASKLLREGAQSAVLHYRFYQPRAGIHDGKVAGRKVFSLESIEEWRKVTDEMRFEYLMKFSEKVAQDWLEYYKKSAI